MDDEFVLNDSDLANDNKPTILDEARLKVLECVTETSNKMRDNIKYNEKSNYENNLKILVNYQARLMDVEELATQKLSDEEYSEKIDKIFNDTTELTFSNIDDIVKDQNVDIDGDGSSDSSQDLTDDGSTPDPNSTPDF